MKIGLRVRRCRFHFISSTVQHMIFGVMSEVFPLFTHEGNW